MKGFGILGFCTLELEFRKSHGVPVNNYVEKLRNNVVVDRGTR